MKFAVLGAGFIGLNFIYEAESQGYSVAVLDHKVCPPDLVGRVRWIQGDLSQEQSVTQVVADSEVVFHFISSTVPGDLVDEGVEFSKNVFATIQLLKICVQQKIRRIVFVSSASVYGIQSQFPILESAQTNPISSHGVHKLAIEKYLYLYNMHYGLDYKIVRLSNPYGPGQSLDGRQGLIAIAINALLFNKPLLLRGDGEDVRDFIYIENVLQVLLALPYANFAEPIINVSSGEGYSINRVLSLLEKLVGKTFQKQYTEHRNVDIPVSILDTSLLNRLLDIGKMISLERGLQKTLMYHGLIK
mgnify:CR=1 FL=1